MIELPHSLAAAATDAFKTVLQQELPALAEQLPLRQGMTQGSYPLNDGVQVMLLSVDASPQSIKAKVGVFFQAIIAGCSCADDPTPLDEVSEYCELELVIDRRTARTTVTLSGDD